MPATDHLSSKEFEEAAARARDDYTRNAVRRDKPVVYLIGGQPGAGKNAVLKKCAEELQERGGYVLVNTDLLMNLHPRYVAHVRQNSETAAATVHDPASALAQSLRQYGVNHRYNIVDESTFGNTPHALERAKKYKEAGYRVEVLYVAVDHQRSEQGVYGRYEKAMALWAKNPETSNNLPRWVPPRVRDQAYSAGPVTVAEIEKARLADVVTVVNRDGRTLSRTDLVKSSDANRSADVIRTERERSWTPAELRSHVAGWEAIRQDATQRGASEQALQAIAKHAAAANALLARERDQAPPKKPAERPAEADALQQYLQARDHLAELRLHRDWDKAAIRVAEQNARDLRAQVELDAEKRAALQKMEHKRERSIESQATRG